MMRFAIRITQFLIGENLKSGVFIILAGWALHLEGGVPSAEQLLPADCCVLVSVPDWDQAKAFTGGSALGRLWGDQEIGAFRDKSLSKIKTDIIAPLERELGVRFADYSGLLHGQVTFAINRNGWDGTTNQQLAWLFILDTKEGSEQLATNLTFLRKKWGDAGKSLKSEIIREIQFSTLETSGEDLLTLLQGAFPGLRPDKPVTEPKNSVKRQVRIGQSGSLLLIGNNSNVLGKVLARQSGDAGRCLAEQPEFKASQTLFRGAQAVGWISLNSLSEGLMRLAIASDATNGNSQFLPIAWDRIARAIGLDGLKTLAASLTGLPEGTLAQVSLIVPESNRTGFLKLVALENKEAQPPPFVPIEAVKFSRWRLNGPQAWTNFESMVAEISPDLVGLLQMGLRTAGKDHDPNFDFRKSLIDNLGDDFISYEKCSPTPTRDASNSLSSLRLIGASNAEALVQAFKIGFGSISPTNSLTEREFLGHKIYSVPAPRAFNQDDDSMDEQYLHFAAGGNYAAFSTDPSTIQEYLRTNEVHGKNLLGIPSLMEASQKVGGMSNGLFGYINQNEIIRSVLTNLKQETNALPKTLSLPPLSSKILGKEEDRGWQSWLDFSLLPSFNKIGKYFDFLVYAGDANTDGIIFKFFAPSPPGLKK
jgi:hypothetical protein